MSRFETLTRATRAEHEALFEIPFVAAALEGALTLEEYRAFLAQAYHHVKHTVPLLMAAGSALPERLEWLRAALGHYIEEEIGHHEWILDDLRATGADAEAVRRGAPGMPCEVMVAYAYDVVHRRNPVGFLGMVHVLEGTSVKGASRAAERLQRALGLPESAFTYLSSHGELDREHVGFFAGLVERLDDEDDLRALRHCSKVFAKLYGDVFRALEPHASSTAGAR